MMKTLLITEFFPPHLGGTPTMFREIYGRYPKGEVTVITDHQPGDEVVDAQLPMTVSRQAVGMRDCGFLNARSVLHYLRLTLHARWLVRSNRIQIIDCGRVVPEGVVGLLVSRATGIPYRVHALGEELGYLRTSRQLTFLMNLVYRSSSQLLAITKNTKQLLLGIGLPEERIRVVPPAVDATRFVPADDCRLIRDQLGLNGYRILLTIGRLQRRKGHDMVIRALPAIAKEVPSVRYLIAGAGEEERRLRRLAIETGVEDLVRVLGAVAHDHLVSLYQACDVFLMPNREDPPGDIEGFGIVFLEANACGKPVIGGLSGGTGEAIVDGQTGLRVDGESPGAIAKAVLRLLRDPGACEEMGRRGRERALRDFDWDSVSGQIRTLGSMCGT